MSRGVPNRSVLSAHLDAETFLLEMNGKSYFRLNETGQVIWRALEAGQDRDRIVAELTKAFEVDEPTARAEVDRFMAQLEEADLVERATGAA
jgi:hypothetical protein